MSSSNSTQGQLLPDITLDELERLIRILGMMGSTHDGEALNAARLAVRWVHDMDTSWAALLTPPEEALPTGVGVGVAGTDLDALEEAQQADRAQAFKNGYAAGMRDMAAQLRAQAAAASHGVASRGMTGTRAGLGAFSTSPGTFNANQQNRAQGAPGGPVAAPGTPGNGNPWPPGSWQWVAQELLDRHAAVPGVLRSREEAFVGDILRRGFPNLTSAQDTWLRDIAGRAGLSW